MLIMVMRFRMFGFTLFLGIAASALLVIGEYFTTMTWHEFSSTFITPNGFLSFVDEFMRFILPSTLQVTVVGGCIAGWVVGTQRHTRPLKSWIMRGCLGGSALAAVGSVLSDIGRDWIYAWKTGWIGLPEMLRLISHFALGFAVAGAFVGAAVGAYAWHLIRGLPPNPPLNPTVA